MLFLRGAGGGKDGSGGGGIQEDPDTLSSVATARIVDLIGEGECEGLVNGEFSIFLNDIPLRDLLGTPNYKPFTWADTKGTQDQLPLGGFVGTESEESVGGLKLTKSGGKLIRSITDANADSVRVTVAVQGLSQTSDDGKISGASVTYNIYTAAVGGDWLLRKTDTITGKTGSRYQRSTEVALAVHGTGPFQVAIERVTEDSDSALLINDIYWDSFTSINYEKYSYPNSALVATQIDARYFSSVPTRKYHFRGLLVRVPRNVVNSQGVYDRVYRTTGAGTTNGVWDGTFTIAWCDNPVWCYYDLVENERYGAGRYLKGTLNKFNLYEISRYCDGLVPTGLVSNVHDQDQGGQYGNNGQQNAPVGKQLQVMEPRFTLNCVINTADKAARVLANLTSVFRAMTYWSGSGLMLSQDAPAQSSMLYTNANVIDGVFNYQGSSRAQRNTVAIVGWNDIQEGGRQKYEYIEDREGIQRYGIRKVEITAFGCTSRTQARRVGLWMLYTQRYETEVITWKAAFDSAHVFPGEIVDIADKNKLGARWGGRVVASTTTSITMDAPLTLAAGTYTLSVMSQDGGVNTRDITLSAGTYSTLNFAALPKAPSEMAIWTLSNPGGVITRQARVVGIKEEEGLYVISAIEHNPSKFDAIELGAAITNFDYSFLEYGAVPGVTGLTTSESTYRVVRGALPTVNMEISWNHLTSPLVRGYVVKLVGNSGSTVTYPETKDSAYTARNIDPDTYKVYVHAVNQFGIPGQDTMVQQIITGQDTKPPANVLNFRSELNNQGYQVFWDLLNDYIDYYEIREGTVWGAGTVIAQVSGNNYVIGAITGPSIDLMIKAVDTSGNPSTNATALHIVRENIDTPVVSSTFQNGNAVLVWNRVDSNLAIRVYKVRYGADWASGAATEVEVQATTYTTPLTWQGDRRFMVRAEDVGGNQSTEGVCVVNVAKPGGVLNLAYSFADSDAVLVWDAPTGPLPIKEYRLRYGDTYAASTALGTTASSRFATPATWGTQTPRRHWVVAVDVNNVEGSPVSIDVAIPVPGSPVVTAYIEGTNYKLAWQPPVGGLRIDEYEVYYGANLAGATYLGSVKGTTWGGEITWSGSRQFLVQAVDSGRNKGAPGTATVTITAPSAPTVTCSITKDYQASVKWTVPASTLPISKYRVTWLVGTDNRERVIVGTELITAIDWTGSMTFTVVAIDSAGNEGAPGTGNLVVQPPGLTHVAEPILDGSGFILNWYAPPGSLPIVAYEIRYGADFATGTYVAKLNADTFRVEGAWLGDRQFWVAAIDQATNYGEAGARTVTIVAPPAPVVTTQVIDNNVLLRWSSVPGTLPIRSFQVRRGGEGSTVDDAELIGELNGAFTVVFEAASGYYNYFITPVDTAGNSGGVGMATAFVNQPPDYKLFVDRNSDFNGANFEFSANGDTEGYTTSGATEQVIDGELVLVSTGTTPFLVRALTDTFFYGCEHPRIRMKLRRLSGSGWTGKVQYTTDGHGYSQSFRKTITPDPTSIGSSVVIEFDMTALTAGGTDWMDNRINAFRIQLGNTSSDSFAIEWIRIVSYMGSNVRLTEDNKLRLPMNIGETYAAHFTNRSWTSPDDQVAAGYPSQAQPTPTSAWYEEQIDYGAVVPASQIAVTPTLVNLIHTVSLVPTISVREHTTDAWTDFVGSLNVFATNFRYVKIRLDATLPDNKSLAELSNLNMKLSVKKKYDSGTVNALASDGVTGTVVNFNTAFIDVESIQLTAQGTQSRNAIYTFVDIPNPTHFTVLVFDKDGVQVDCTVSWDVTGV